MTLTAAVITATIGRPTLEKTITSIESQTYPCKHYVFVNGSQYRDLAEPILRAHPNVIATYINEPACDRYHKAGPEGVFPATIFLVDTDVMTWLDDDDCAAPNHIESIVSLMEKYNLFWAYPLCQIIDTEGNILYNDDCERLGYWPAYDGSHVAIGYTIRKPLAVAVANGWYYGTHGDRGILDALQETRLAYGCTGQYTLYYRLWRKYAEYQKELFARENEKNRLEYPNGFPWAKPTVFPNGGYYEDSKITRLVLPVPR